MVTVVFERVESRPLFITKNRVAAFWTEILNCSFFNFIIAVAANSITHKIHERASIENKTTTPDDAVFVTVEIINKVHLTLLKRTPITIDSIIDIREVEQE